jgi:hypothetical protein
MTARRTTILFLALSGLSATTGCPTTENEVGDENPVAQADAGSPFFELTVNNVGEDGIGEIVSVSDQESLACVEEQCVFTLAAGTVLELRAQTTRGTSFVGWSGACAGDALCSVEIAADTEVSARFDPSGKPLDAFALENVGRSFGITHDEEDNLFVLGGYTGAGNLLGTNSIAIDGIDGYVARYSSDKELVWATPLPIEGFRSNTVVPIQTSADAVYAVGATRPNGVNADRYYVTKLDKDTGAIEWTRRGPTGRNYFSDALATASGNLLLAGSTDGMESSFGADIVGGFLLSFDDEGNQIAATQLPWNPLGLARTHDDKNAVLIGFPTYVEIRFVDDLGQSVAPSVSVPRNRSHFSHVIPHPSEDVFYLVGSHTASLSFGGLPQLQVASPPVQEGQTSAQSNVLVAKIRKGELEWVRSYGGDGAENCWDGAVDPNGNLALIGAGGYSGTVDLGEGTLPRHGRYDLWVASFDSEGEPRWTRTMGSEESDYELHNISVKSDGEVVIRGNLSGAIDTGTGPLVLTEAGDTAQRAFLATYGR